MSLLLAKQGLRGACRQAATAFVRLHLQQIEQELEQTHRSAPLRVLPFPLAVQLLPHGFTDKHRHLFT